MSAGCAISLFVRECSFGQQRRANCPEIGFVHRQNLYRYATDRRLAYQIGAIPLEVLAPSIATWMEEPDQFASPAIAACDVGAFVPIAVEARQG